VPRIEDTPRRCEFFFRRLKVSTYLFLMVLSCSTIQQMYPTKPAEREDSRVKARKEGL
jgi:hypothetical protein